MCWKAAHYMDSHDNSGHALSGLNKTFCTELMQRVVVDCMWHCQAVSRQDCLDRELLR
jgi:hypothetical protein